MTAKVASKAPWRVPVRRDDVPESGLHLDLAADETVRAAVATLAGVRALPRFTASFDVMQLGDGLKVTGEIAASVDQTCVVTLEPMTSELREPIDLVFVAPGAGAQPDETVADIDPVGDETEFLVDGVADLGAAATEFLLLAIDPYPRKPDAVFEPPTSDDPAAHPFAALAALKKGPGET
jgi:uncharacterized metal-binding protein YceD (DUF177 family)